MGPQESPPEGGRWVSASDLADYAFCPRSHYYRHHPPAAGPTMTSQSVRQRGTLYHASYLGASESREAHALGWGLVAVTSLLLLVLVAVGFVAGWWGP